VKTILATDYFPYPTTLNADFPVFVLDDFIPPSECSVLVEAAVAHMSASSMSSPLIHGGRCMMPWSSPSFADLLASSRSWSSLCKTLPGRVYSLLLEFLRDYTSSSLETLKATALLEMATLR